MKYFLNQYFSANLVCFRMDKIERTNFVMGIIKLVIIELIVRANTQNEMFVRSYNKMQCVALSVHWCPLFSGVMSRAVIGCRPQVHLSPGLAALHRVPVTDLVLLW